MKDIQKEFEEETGWWFGESVEMNGTTYNGNILNPDRVSANEHEYYKAFSEWQTKKLIKAREELEEVKKETILDIINSENSGLSAEQRLDEIKNELQHNPC